MANHPDVLQSRRVVGRKLVRYPEVIAPHVKAGRQLIKVDWN